MSFKRGTGWIKDYPDFRDQGPDTFHLTGSQMKRGVKEPVSEMLSHLRKKSGKKTSKSKNIVLPAKVDLRKWCSPIDDQGDIGSCTAHAGTALYEYFERRAFGKHVDASRLFLYKVTRNLLGWHGDDGAELRTTMGAMALFGLVPEKYWPYVEHDFNKEPEAFQYSFAQNYQALVYYRLDGIGVNKDVLLKRIKEHLHLGLPSIFGFTCYTSLDEDEVVETGKIPFPGLKEKINGGHAVMAVGYDDNITIENPLSPKIKTKGAILIRNSWGKNWGDKGYGWLPYEFVKKGIADDWWTMIKGEWVETEEFGI